MSETPWAGLAALVAMFVIPLLPEWLFEGRRSIKHWPRRHVCGYCAVPWTDGHACEPSVDSAARRPLQGELRRLEETPADPGVD
jgi:hypothetical protein